MRRFIIALFLVFPVCPVAQTPTTVTGGPGALVPGNPPGGIGAACTDLRHAYLTASGLVVTCVAKVYTVTGGGTNVNGASVASPNFNATTPAAEAGYQNVKFQVSGSSVSGEVSISRVPVSFTGDTVLSAAQMYLGDFDNTGASAQINLTLGSVTCSVGQIFTVTVQAGYPIKLTPFTGDQIMGLTDAATDSITSDSVADTFVTLQCRQAGKWRLRGMNGAWTDTN